jgi:hypothetical protein
VGLEILEKNGMLTESQRRREVSRYGEIKARELLTKVLGLSCEELRVNYHCFDIVAEKDGKIAAVKTRNHTTHTGDIKIDGYNLFTGGRAQRAYEIAREWNAIPIWVAVTVDAPNQRVSACWGYVDGLANKTLIPLAT